MKLIALLALIPALALAQSTLKRNERLLTITPATTCEDGSTDLSQCPFLEYRIETATSCTAITWEFLTTIPSTQLTYKATGLTAGPHCWRVKARAAEFTTTASPILPASLSIVTTLNPGRPGGITASDKAP